MNIAQLKEVLEELGHTTGAHNFKECHDALEHQREMGEIISRSDDTTKKVLIPEWEKVPSIWLRQQMAGYSLLQRIEAGDKAAVLSLDEMITVCKAIT